MNLHDPVRAPHETQAEYRARRAFSKGIAKLLIFNPRGKRALDALVARSTK